MARKHTKEFQQEAVRIALSSDLSRKQVASDLGVGFSTLSRWIQIHRHKDDVSVPTDIDMEQEVKPADEQPLPPELGIWIAGDVRLVVKGGFEPEALCYSLIETCKLNGVNPQSWLTYALTNIQDTKLSDLDKLMPWNYVEES